MQAAKSYDYIAKLERLNSTKNKDVVQNWLDKIVKRAPKNPVATLNRSER